MEYQEIDHHYADPLFKCRRLVREKPYVMHNLHYHEAYEIYMLEEGEHQYILGDKIYDIRPYDVIMIPSNVPHKSSGTKKHIRISAYFTEKFLDLYYTENAKKVLLKCFEFPKISLTREDFKGVKHLASLLEACDPEKNSDRIFIYLSFMIDIIYHNRDNKQIPDNPKNNTISHILSYINQNFSSIKTIDEIAEHFHFTKYHLCHIFKEETGMTIIGCLNSIKINNACFLLKTAAMSITDVAMECGFNSPEYFCSAFKKTIGMTPKEYRKTSLAEDK